MTEVERVWSANLHEPVKILHTKIGMIPIPQRADIALQSMRIIFNIRSLLKPQRVIHRITLENGGVAQAKMEKIPALLQGDGATLIPFRVEELQFNGIRLVAAKLFRHHVG